MSRLIFEGNTRERFGELFPKPFIEEIRVFDTTIETDVAVYFEVPEGLTAEEFLEETGMDQLRIYVGALTEDVFVRLTDSESNLDFIRDSINLDGLGAFWAKTGGESEADAGDSYSSYNLLQFGVSSEFFYNSNGQKFVKFLLTDTIEHTYEYYFPRVEQGKYIIVGTFFPDNDITDTPFVDTAAHSNPELYKNQLSEIVYHKLFNDGGSLNKGRQIVYLELDGNYYSSIPLRGLDRIYRKVNLITHQQAQDLIQATIQSSVGLLAEADLISETLQKFSNDPNLLLEIQKNINNFSNKSSATAIGTLYGQLVDVVVEIDNILTRSEKLEKRLIFSSKVIDRRQRPDAIPENQLLVSATENLDPDVNLQHEIGDPYTNMVKNFVDLPFFCRYMHLNTPAPGAGSSVGPEDYFVENFMYILFDYEKSLNYLSEISRFFNPYNILQLFGPNCLNKNFSVNRIFVQKRDADNPQAAFNGNSTLRATLVSPAQADMMQETRKESYSYTLPPSREADNGFAFVKFGDDTISRGERLFSRLAERAFDTADGLNGYRLKCYEVAFLEAAERAMSTNYLFFQYGIDVEDTTMVFFKDHIHLKLLSLLADLNEYLLFAEQFCSYNNIDNKFNDFFNDNIRQEFSEPFVWEEAPKYFYAIRALIGNSWVNSDVDGERKKDGTLINMERVKQLSILKNSEINPKTGTLNLLRSFVQDFTELEDKIGYGGPWAQTIWDVTNDTTPDASVLNVPSKIHELRNYRAVDPRIIDEVEFVPAEETKTPEADEIFYAKRNSWSKTASKTSLDVEEMLTALLGMDDLNYTRHIYNRAGPENYTQNFNLPIIEFMYEIIPEVGAAIMDDTNITWESFFGAVSESGDIGFGIIADDLVESIFEVRRTDPKARLRELFPLDLNESVVDTDKEKLKTKKELEEFFQIIVPSVEAYNNIFSSDRRSIKSFTEMIVSSLGATGQGGA